MVLGPKEVRKIMVPYQLQGVIRDTMNYGVCFHDCRAHIQLRFTLGGQPSLCFRNLTSQAIQLTPRSRAFWISAKARLIKQEIVNKVVSYGTCLERQFPSLFADPESSMKMTPPMAVYCVCKEDIQVAHAAHFINKCKFQSISLCTQEKVDQDLKLFSRLGLIEELQPHKKGFFSQTLIFEKPGTGKPRITLDLRRLNKHTKMVHYPLPRTQTVVQ